MVVWIRNVSCWLGYLDSWFRIGDIVWWEGQVGGVALMEEVCLRRQALRVHSLSLLPVHSVSCLHLRIQILSFLVLVLAATPSRALICQELWDQLSFSSLSGLWSLSVTATEEELVQMTALPFRRCRSHTHSTSNCTQMLNFNLCPGTLFSVSLPPWVTVGSCNPQSAEIRVNTWWVPPSPLCA